MPAYFSITFELNKGQNVIRDFCEALIKSGLSFKCGYGGFKKHCYEDIITWNQSKLDEDFVLGYTEHYSHDYKQMLFEYSDFSEVRVFVMNYRNKPTFTFELIVPEDDLVYATEEKDGKYSWKRKTERMNQLKSLAKKVWVNSAVLAIQTGWELSETPPLAGKISEGIKPQIEPFCIINSSSSEYEMDLVFENIERSGVLIDRTQWF